jgi:hypothetical protein
MKKAKNDTKAMLRSTSCVCVCVRERESECVCVCVCVHARALFFIYSFILCCIYLLI